MSAIEIGDKVQYSARFLKSIGCYTGELPFAKGRVTYLQKVGSLTIASVAWGNPSDVPEGVNVANLKRISEVENV